MESNIDKVYVYENWKSDKASLMGYIYAEGGKGKKILSFEALF